jgi:hypothetical protein
MGFFDRQQSEPELQHSRSSRPIWMKQGTRLPVTVGSNILLARNQEAAVVITSLRSYPDGFELTLSAIVRRPESHELFRYRPVVVRGHPDSLPGEFIRFGLEFSDGRATTNLSSRPATESGGPVMMGIGGGGGGQRYDMTYWVWPLPPPGPLTFVCQWPVHCVGESRVVIDAQSILDAAPQGIELWPEDDDPKGVDEVAGWR